MKFSEVILLRLLLIGTALSVGLFQPKTNATPLVLAVPAAGIGALELTASAATAAAMYGFISQKENESLQSNLSNQIANIQTVTKQVQTQAMHSAGQLFNRVTSRTKHETCESKNSNSSENCTSGPEVCCKDYLKKFQDRVEKQKGGIKVFKAGAKAKVECCLEFDHLHGALEIFDKHGKHMGERGCDDLSTDPCQWTQSRGKHAAPASTTHKPRTPACHH